MKTKNINPALANREIIVSKGGVKAIALLSGGLDSILATKLVMQQGVTVEALNFVTVFCTCTKKDSSCLASQSAARQLGMPLKVINVSKEYLEVVKSPKHGYGSNMNPCIDCRIFMFKKAKEYMQETGASFIVTGEVVGQRPMSQKRHTLRHIEKETGLDGLILRPLSAKMLEPTIPEKEGWVARDKFMDIQGRGRKPQFQLADDLDIKDYPCPAGGCLLTDPGFAKRIKDLIKHDEFTLENVNLLKLGRHFRISEADKAIVGRDETENSRLLALIKDGDAVFKTLRYPGPVVLGRGRLQEAHHDILASIAARYSDADGAPFIEVEYYRHAGGNKNIIKVRKCPQEALDGLRI